MRIKQFFEEGKDFSIVCFPTHNDRERFAIGVHYQLYDRCELRQTDEHIIYIIMKDGTKERFGYIGRDSTFIVLPFGSDD